MPDADFRIPGLRSPTDIEQAERDSDAWTRELRAALAGRARRLLGMAWRWAGTGHPLYAVGRILRARARPAEQKAAAVRALGLHGHPIGLRICAGFLADRQAEPAWRQAAAEALARGGRVGLAALAGALDDRDRAVRTAAAVSLLLLEGRRMAPGRLAAVGGVIEDTSRWRHLLAHVRGETEAVAAAGLAGALRPDAARWALASLHAERDAAEEVAWLLDPATGDLAVLQEAPRVAVQHGEALAAALSASWRPDDPLAGRRLHLAALLDDLAAPAIAAWAPAAEVTRPVQVLAGLLGLAAPAGMARDLAGALRAPEGIGVLVEGLDEPESCDKATRYILHHRLLWPRAIADRELEDRVFQAAYASRDQASIVWLAGELRVASCVNFLEHAFPIHPYASWALGEIGTPEALAALGRLDPRQAKPGLQEVCTRHLAWAWVQAGLAPRDLPEGVLEANREDCCLLYALLRHQETRLSGPLPESLAGAVLRLARDGAPWRGPADAESLDEASALLRRARRPGPALHLVGAALAQGREDQALDLLARLAPRLGPADHDALRKLGDAAGPDSMLHHYATALGVALGSVPPALPDCVEDEMSVGRLRMAHHLLFHTERAAERGTGLVVLAPVLESAARTRLSWLVDEHLDEVLASAWGVARRRDLGDGSPAVYDITGRVVQWIVHGHKPDRPLPDLAKVVRGGLHKLGRLDAAPGEDPSGHAAPVDGLSFWIAVLGLLEAGDGTLRRLAPSGRPAELCQAMAALQPARNTHVHSLAAMSAHQAAELWELALLALREMAKLGRPA